MKKTVKTEQAATKKRQPVRPSKGIYEGSTYVKAVSTDVTKTWARFGWKPVFNN